MSLASLMRSMRSVSSMRSIRSIRSISLVSSMKRFVIFLSVAAVAIIMVSPALMFTPAAFADAIATPDNSFYIRHNSECVYLNRGFYANGEGGSVSLKKEPGSSTETGSVENGVKINIMFTYEYKGETWGVTTVYISGKSYNEFPTGWVPFSQLLLAYDYICFNEDHQEEIYNYTGGYDSLKEAEKIVLWSWPGSGVELSSIQQGDFDYNNLGIDSAYKDGEGREWGFIGYWYGARNVWVCISDPSNSDIPAFNPEPKPALWQPDGADNNTSAGGPPVPVLAIILVSSAVVCTAVLIRLVSKP